jgi:hypothetical protein
MKHIIATLLIALAVSVSAQERTSALKDLSNVDPATGRTALDVPSNAEAAALIDNTAVNAAIAEDPAASRAALNVAEQGGAMTADTITADAFTVKGSPVPSILLQKTWYPDFSNWTLNTGTVAATSYAAQLKMLTAGTASSTVICHTAPSSECFPMLRFGSSSARGDIDFTGEVWMSWRFNIFTSNATSVLRGWIGQYTGATTDPTAEGFGFEVTNTELKILAYKTGTGVTRSPSSIATINNDDNYRLIMRKEANGTISAWLDVTPDQTPTATLSTGPTSSCASGSMELILTNGATASAVRAHAAVPCFHIVD